MSLREKIKSIMMDAVVFNPTMHRAYENSGTDDQFAESYTEAILAAFLESLPEKFSEINYHNEEYAQGYNDLLTEIKDLLKHRGEGA